MAVVEQLEAVLDLDDRGFSVKIRGASGEMKRFATSLARMDRNIEKSTRKLHGMTATLRDWTVIIGQARSALNQLYFVFGQLPVSIIRVNSEIERMEFLLKGMSKEATEAGKSLDASRMVNTLFDMAREAPFSVGAMTDSFVKFRSVGLEPLDGSMQSLMDAVAAFGGTDETLKRASIAIQQMGGKGVISMEELRQQLGEAVPQAITIMAQSMGVSYGELVDKISKGTVAAKPALDAMFNGFESVFGGRAAAMMDTFSGRVAVMRTNLKELVNSSSGMDEFFEATKDLVFELGKLFGSDAAKGFADDMGRRLASITTWLTQVTSEVSIAYGKVASFYNLMIEPFNTEGSTLYKIKQVLMEIIEVTNMASEEMFKFLSGTDERDLMKRRLLDGRDIADEEKDLALSIYEEETEKLARAKKERDRRLNALSGPDIMQDAIFVVGREANIASEERDRINARIAMLDDERRAINAKLLEMRGDISVNAQAERVALQQRQNGLIEEQNNYITKLNQSTERERVARSALAQIRMHDGNAEGLAKTLSDPANELSQALQFLNSAFPTFKKITDELDASNAAIETLESNVEAMSKTLKSEFEQEVEGMLEEPMKALEELQTQFSTQNQEMWEELRTVAEDATLDQAQKAEQAAEITTQMAEAQINAVTALGEAAQAELSAQGEAGMEAAARFAQFVLQLIAQIQSTSAEIPKRIGAGIVTVNKPGGGGGGRRSAGERAADRLKTVSEQLQRDLTRVQEKLADPFGFEIPKAIQKTEDKLSKIIGKLPEGTAAAERFTGEMKKLLQVSREVALGESMLDLQKDTRSSRRSRMSTSDQARMDAKDQIKQLTGLKAYFTEFGLWRQEHERVLQERILTIREEAFAATPLGAWANEWRSFGEEIGGFMADTFKGISSQLTEMIVSGEADLDDFARSILSTFLNISINSGLSALYSGLSGGTGGGGGFFKGLGKMLGIVSHTGSIVDGSSGTKRSIDASLFSNAPRFHTGGIVGDEVPAILKKKEGVFTPEQMKAMGGLARTMPNIGINVINNSGTPMEAEQGETRFDGEKAILDVVLSAANRSGNFRDSMKEALR